ncbi:MAG: GFA family protein [Parahaliea sp.]
MHQQRVGACLCGNIQYQCEGEPLTVIQCHCKNCQKQSGSAFSVNLVYKMRQVQINRDALGHYQDRGDSGNPVHRYFCPNCGSAVVTGNADLSGIGVIKAGTLNDTAGIAPQMSIWDCSAQGWVRPLEGIPHFQREMEQP